MAGRFDPQSELGPQLPANNLLGSILVTLLCCLPFGIVAIVYGLQVKPRFKQGDYDGAQRASDMSEKWMYASVGVSILVGLATLAWFVFNHFFASKSGGAPSSGR